MGSSSGISAGKAFLELLVDDKEFLKGLDASLKSLEDWGKSAVKVGGSMAAMGGAILAPFAGAVAVFTSAGAAMDDMSARTGQTVENLSELKFAANQSGTSIEAVEKAMGKMAKAGDTRTFDEVAKSITAIKDPAQKIQAAMAAWGKSGAELIPMAADLAKLREEARESGVVMSGESAAAAAALDDAWGKLKDQATALAVTVGTALAPAITGLVTSFTEAMPGIIEFVDHNRSLITFVAGAGVALFGIGTIIATVGTIVWGTVQAIKAMQIALLVLSKNPWAILITVALVAITALLGPMIDKWTGVNEQHAVADETAKKSAKSLEAQAAALGKGNKKLDERQAALAKLSQSEQEWVAIGDRQKKQATEAKAVSDLKIEAIDAESKVQQDAFNTLTALEQEHVMQRARLQKEQGEGGSARFQGNVAEAMKANEKEIADIQAKKATMTAAAQERQAKRDELSGEAAKKRAEEIKKIDEQVAKAKEEMQKRQEQIAKEAEAARMRRAQDVERAADSVASQFESFSRPTVGTMQSGASAQIFGTSAAQGTEQRALKLSEEQRDLLREIKIELKGRALVAGAS